MVDKIEEKLSIAKSKLILNQPFFASIICKMPIERDDSVGTMGTNGRWIKYNADFVDKLSMDELLFVLCHEVGHVMFVHPFRRQHRHPLGWNIAGDYVINDMLVNDKVGTMPKMGLLDHDLVQKAGGTTDGVYELLSDKLKQGPSEYTPGEGGMPLDKCDDAGGDPAEQAEAEAEARVMIAQAAQIAKAEGKLNGTLARLVEYTLKPKVVWQDVLRRFVSARAKVDLTYARPKRRFLAADLFLPSLGGESMGDILIAVDCSGSISEKDLNEFATEIKAIKDDVRPAHIHVLYFDSRVSHYDKFAQDEDLHVEAHGGGGTAFSPIFAYAEAMEITPECCVVLTDLCCSDFGPPPSYPTLWVSNYSSDAPWGEVVMMKDKVN